MGSVYQDAGEIEKAIDCYRKAVSFKSNFAEAYQNMAVALHDQMNCISKGGFSKVLGVKVQPNSTQEFGEFA